MNKSNVVSLNFTRKCRQCHGSFDEFYEDYSERKFQYNQKARRVNWFNGGLLVGISLTLVIFTVVIALNPGFFK